MANEKTTLTFDAADLHLLWDALTHKERYHREFAEKLAASDSLHAAPALETNAGVLAAVQGLAGRLEAAIQTVERSDRADQKPSGCEDHRR